MVKRTLRRWRKPPPMFVFMLAVMLPAAALIIAGVLELRHIQRDQIIDAAIQRDYAHTLKIADERIVERAYETSEKARAQFPDVDHPEDLDAFLAAHPEITHAFLWTGKGDLDFRSQPGRMADPAFRAEHKEIASELAHVLDMWSGEQIAKVKKIEESEGRTATSARSPYSAVTKCSMSLLCTSCLADRAMSIRRSPGLFTMKTT